MALFKKAPPPPPPSASRPDLVHLLRALPETDSRAISRAAPELEYLDRNQTPEETIFAITSASFATSPTRSALSDGVIVLTGSRVIAVIGYRDKHLMPDGPPLVRVYKLAEITDISDEILGKNYGHLTKFHTTSKGEELNLGSTAALAQTFVDAVRQQVNRAKLAG